MSILWSSEVLSSYWSLNKCQHGGRWHDSYKKQVYDLYFLASFLVSLSVEILDASPRHLWSLTLFSLCPYHWALKKTLFIKGYSFIKQTFTSGLDTRDGLHLLSVARGDRKGIRDLRSERWIEGRKNGREDVSGTGNSMCKGPVWEDTILKLGSPESREEHEYGKRWAR